MSVPSRKSTPQKRKKPLTKQQKRIAIAKDVIKQLRTLNVWSSTYLEPTNGAKTIEQELCHVDHKRDADTLAKNCKVCAIGASFISYIRLFNKFDLESLDWYLWGPEFPSIAPPLQKIFGEKQLNFIESAFEMVNIGHTPDSFELEQAIAFGSRYRNAKNRLKAIMENIVKNKGCFIPSNTASRKG